MQSIDQQAAASQTSGQPLSRNSRIQTPKLGTSGAAFGRAFDSADDVYDTLPAGRAGGAGAD
jgi:hypothetical protein